jgi:signal peptidase
MAVLGHVVNRMVSLLAGLAILVALAGGVLIAAGYRFEPVLSGSMEPLMPVGSVVVVKTIPASTVQEGDVITFRHPLAPSKQITHRVVGIRGEGPARRYSTKGDALAKPDPWQLQLPHEVGRRATTIPHLGVVLQRLSDGRVLALLAALTTLLVIAAILRRVWAAPAPPAAHAAPGPRRAAPTAYGTPW